MPRARDLSLVDGGLPPGAANAITDVAGVLVGHTTLIAGAGPLIPGHGPVRTGVTVVLPHGGNMFREKVRAAVYTINGFGKALGFEQVRELGLIESPIALTNTLNVGLVADEAGAIDWLFYAVAESVEEAVLNSLCMAETTVGRDGHTAPALPLDEVVTLVRRCTA